MQFLREISAHQPIFGPGKNYNRISNTTAIAVFTNK